MLIDPRSKDAAITKGYLRTAQAAQYLGIGQSTLERMRANSEGPAHRVIGAKIVIYAISDLDAYASRKVFAGMAQAA
jgi:excisionase family DNA binding protein